MIDMFDDMLDNDLSVNGDVLSEDHDKFDNDLSVNGDVLSEYHDYLN